MGDFAAFLFIMYIVIGCAVGATWPIWIWFLAN